MKAFRYSLGGYLLTLCLLMLAPASHARSPLIAQNPVNDAATWVQQLRVRDPLLRQRAAEELARLAAVEQRKLVEGYRLQEKNDRVRLALDWALYRFGKTDALFAVVNALDSPRSDQAFLYLTQIEGPQPLHVFLENGKRGVKLKLFDVFAQVGDQETLRLVQSLTSSTDAKIAAAAKESAQKISHRLSQPAREEVTRPRQVGQGSTTLP